MADAIALERSGGFILGKGLLYYLKMLVITELLAKAHKLISFIIDAFNFFLVYITKSPSTFEEGAYLM